MANIHYQSRVLKPYIAFPIQYRHQSITLLVYHMFAPDMLWICLILFFFRFDDTILDFTCKGSGIENSQLGKIVHQNKPWGIEYIHVSHTRGECYPCDKHLLYCISYIIILHFRADQFSHHYLLQRFMTYFWGVLSVYIYIVHRYFFWSKKQFHFNVFSQFFT